MDENEELTLLAQLLAQSSTPAQDARLEREISAAARGSKKVSIRMMNKR
jgi:hypothetical protein